ncbi:aromatic ring-hydroxylating dioxygenase subunit alpha [Picosynechococcus sp. PCC 7117]|uniref:aromatic ring-hydroxylating dioxygenase subunit alpha n=1 Tax=Picosynechococcus sp. PCC 7117 TaxID=195498 RepID=UPI0008109F54|nr:aromatic ring-hydroxylating dioxygenase subunit alpha [Picosynechococcus sp. PCC 7117]ANV88000.1 3-chlorobenzoate-3,4-dioxygenase [Picosynechococcus sp. PCC 7117]
MHNRHPQAVVSSSSVTPQKLDVRACGINKNHWYVAARSAELTDQPLGFTLWNEDFVLYRDQAGQVQALEDRCPHRQVKLSSGQVVGDNLECAYHGWQFDASGTCAHVPYLAENQKRPACKIRTLPVREQDGFIWVFPGDPERLTDEAIQPLPIPEWEHLNYIVSVTTIDCEGHFSYLIENLMDMYHGHLHDNYQAWASAKLEDIQVTEQRVDAHYEAQSYYKIDKIWSISQLFFPALRKLHPEPLDVSYVYPNWSATLGNDFKIMCLFCPTHSSRTRAYLLHFTSLNAFWRLHKLPVPFRRWVKDLCFNAAKGLLDGLVEQDVLMIEQEQRAYLENPQRQNVELNRALMAVQRLIKQQAIAQDGVKN